MRRQPDHRAGADDLARVRRRQIVLADVDTARAGKTRHIRAIVHDNRDSAAGHRNDRIGDVERPLQRT
jgi:hypothetical protein